MKRHPLDLLSAALGVVAVVIGVLVMSGSIDTVSTGGSWWLAVLALIVGIGLIPWNLRRTDAEPAGDDDVYRL